MIETDDGFSTIIIDNDYIMLIVQKISRKMSKDPRGIVDCQIHPNVISAEH